MISKYSRAPWHDYKSRGMYMITMSKDDGVPLFGVLDADLNNPRIALHTTGKAVRDAVWHISDLNPAIKLMQYVVMPDHVHALIHVHTALDEHLGATIARLKVTINQKAGMTHIFKEGFNDQIIDARRNLNVIFRYIKTNPQRLAVRRQHPDFFTRCNDYVINNEPYSLYGNMQLLDNPFKEQVVVHRADSLPSRISNEQRWLYAAANGGVLVSPFISRDEMSIRDKARALNARMIIITNEPMGERYKPSGVYFEMCEAGRLLIIAPKYYTDLKLTRAACLKMNTLAAHISTR